MVKTLTGSSKRGLIDWLCQRASAVVLLCYIIFLIGYFATHSPLTYAVWSSSVHHVFFQVMTLLALAALIIHAWVGLWTIFTDYIHARIIRRTIYCLVVFSFLVYVIWTIFILWG